MECAPSLLRLLDELARLQRRPSRRLALLELVRPTVRQVGYALEAHYLNRPLLLPPPARRAAGLADALFDRLARGYESVGRTLLGGRRRARADRHAGALTLQRAMDALAQRLLLHFLMYAHPETELWARLHRLYALAESEALEGIGVADPALPGQEGSVHLAYARVLLVASAQPNQLRQPALMALYRAAANWARWLPLFEDSGDARFAVDLQSDAPPFFPPVRTALPGRRFFDTRPLAAAVHGGSPPGPLSEPLRHHLCWVWLGPRRRRGIRQPAGGYLALCLGLDAVHRRLAGPAETSTALRARRLDQCCGGYRLEWRGQTPPELRAGAVVGLREPDGGDWRVAEVRWVESDCERVRFGIALLPATVRPVRVSTGAEAGAPALLVPAPTVTDSDTLLLPGPGYRSGARVTLWDRGARSARLGLRVGGSPDVIHYTLREPLPA